MTKCTFDQVTLKSQKRRYRKIGKPKPVKAFDTETYRGQAFVLCDSDGVTTEINNELDMLKTLSDFRNTRYINFFYNIDYDVRAFLSYMPNECLQDLYVTNELIYDDYYLFYIPRKYLKVRKGKRGVSYFDLFHYCNCSLNEATFTYLGLNKLDLPSPRWKEWSWIVNFYDMIVDYCKHDAWITQQLGVFIRDMFNKMRVDFNKPYSPASIAAQYFSRYMPTPPYFCHSLQRYAFNAYHGGRFECFQRGYFPNALKVDIRSAYPHAMYELPDITRGKWLKVSGSIPEGAALGFVRCNLGVSDKSLSPLTFKTQGRIIYPRAKVTDYFISLQEYNMLNEFGYVNKELKDAWVFIPSSDTRPFEGIERLFSMKEEYKNDNNPLAHTIKVILNSIYGKTIEVIAGWEKIKDPVVPVELRGVLSQIKHSYKRVFKAGKLYNPVIASFITAHTRVKILRESLKAMDALIALFTDCLITTKSYIPFGNELGDWCLEDKGRLILLGSGVYQFLDNDKRDFHIRGFRVSKDKTLYDMLCEHSEKGKIPLPQEHALSLGRYLLHTNFASGYYLNEFRDFSKELDINFDLKRAWGHRFASCNDVLTQSHASVTLQYRPEHKT